MYNVIWRYQFIAGKSLVREEVITFDTKELAELHAVKLRKLDGTISADVKPA